MEIVISLGWTVVEVWIGGWKGHFPVRFPPPKIARYVLPPPFVKFQHEEPLPDLSLKAIGICVSFVQSFIVRVVIPMLVARFSLSSYLPEELPLVSKGQTLLLGGPSRGVHADHFTSEMQGISVYWLSANCLLIVVNCLSIVC